jgi:hypothetical protein
MIGAAGDRIRQFRPRSRLVQIAQIELLLHHTRCQTLAAPFLGVFLVLAFAGAGKPAWAWGMDKSAAIVPSTKKVGGPGCTIDVPIAHANAAYVRSHFDTVVCSINDAPRAKEIVWIQSMPTAPRIYSRSGGLRDEDTVGEDGLR